MGHLEDPKLTSDLTLARDFDLGMSGPPLSTSMDFIAAGLVELIGGLASCIVLARYSWWMALLLGGAWASTHWLLRESAVWRDRNTPEVRAAQRGAGRRRTAARTAHGAGWGVVVGQSTGKRTADSRDPLSQRHLRLSG